MSVQQKLSTIQTQLKAPKNEFNRFGKYNYRTCESILEAVKPLLKETGTLITLSDEPVNIGDRYYIKATATITDTEKPESISTSAYAREALDKKGMDQAQVTGAASSYARKYALCGLLAIDGDADPDQLAGTQTTKAPEKASKKDVDKLIEQAGKKGFSKELLEKACYDSYKQKLNEIDTQAFAQLSTRIMKATPQNA